MQMGTRARARRAYNPAMPAKSEKQARLFRAAAHGADFAKAREIQQSMSLAEMRKFGHVGKAKKKGGER